VRKETWFLVPLLVEIIPNLRAKFVVMKTTN
jgi:hypothetical protein